ncbi:hypothetical protein Bealeia1_00917 [Candidatus Bealeia paramacronuclearis]|uniref:SHOCT domain-containing protein n=2 Tax=Candidatus Bealeia paramacronuclearis TaxID=1921001 RepID=A0ABZ2C505_9PROT|nr:hypothetical protein [Candidatus Bealeia paramacronuclearis]
MKKVFEKEEAVSQDELKGELKTGKITASTLQDKINKIKDPKIKIASDENKHKKTIVKKLNTEDSPMS